MMCPDARGLAPHFTCYLLRKSDTSAQYSHHFRGWQRVICMGKRHHSWTR